MKIIKEGKWNNPWSGQYNCTTCEGLLEVDEEDLQAQGNETDSNYFLCPICNCRIFIKKEDLPERVLKKLNNERKYWRSGGAYD